MGVTHVAAMKKVKSEKTGRPVPREGSAKKAKRRVAIQPWEDVVTRPGPSVRVDTDDDMRGAAKLGCWIR